MSFPPQWLVVLALERRDRELRSFGADGRSRPPEAPAMLSHPGAASPVLPLLAAPPQWEERTSVQLVVREAPSAVLLLRALAEDIHPDRWIVGVGFGEIRATPGEGSTAVSGDALDNARAALWRARRDRRCAGARGFGHPDDEVVAALVETMDQLRARWTERQRDTVRAARDATGREVARRFGVSPSVVSESLKAAGFRALLQAEDALASLLTQFGTRGRWIGDQVAVPTLTSATAKRPARARRAEV